MLESQIAKFQSKPPLALQSAKNARTPVTNILLELLEGVMEADNPVSTNVSPAEKDCETSLVAVPCTT